MGVNSAFSICENSVFFIWKRAFIVLRRGEDVPSFGCFCKFYCGDVSVSIYNLFVSDQILLLLLDLALERVGNWVDGRCGDKFNKSKKSEGSEFSSSVKFWLFHRASRYIIMLCERARKQSAFYIGSCYTLCANLYNCNIRHTRVLQRMGVWACKHIWSNRDWSIYSLSVRRFIQRLIS